MQITNGMIQKICSNTIYKRGLEYFKQGRVHIRKRDDNAINSIVDGESIYNTQIKFNNDKITDYFCTCPYYQTMDSACKHIVATLIQRQTELSQGDNYTNENDKIASSLCEQFEKISRPKEKLHALFILSVKTSNERKCEYSIEIKLGHDSPSTTVAVHTFLEAYIKNITIKITNKFTYSNDLYYFNDNDTKIINLLAEAYQNQFSSGLNYLYHAHIGSYTFDRILSLILNANFELWINSIQCMDLRILEENPDILIDISAELNEIQICISESGLAITPSGSWFFYNNNLYHTTTDWQNWFMPLYNSLLTESRTQIYFKGDNAIHFASRVLPIIRNKEGVVCHDLDNFIIDQNPIFEVYFDKHGLGIAAIVKVIYGMISMRLPTENIKSEKIIIRDFNKENNVLSCFDTFHLKDGVFLLNDNDEIYNFITDTFRQLSSLATVYCSDTFKQIKISKNIVFSSNIRFNNEVDLLEAGFETDLSSEEIAGILLAIRIKKNFFRLKDGSFLDLNRESVISVFEMLDKLDFQPDDIENNHKILPKQQLLYLASLLNSEPNNVEFDNSFTELVEKIKNIKAQIPSYLDNILREYQKIGVNWFKQLSVLNLGGILADDMGLGKTLQVIAFVCSENKKEPALIVTPSSLIYNWQNEINRFAPNASVIIIDGQQSDRANLIKECTNYMFVITSYPLLRRDIQMYLNIDFSYFFIDEAQYIKNPKTMNSKSVKKIKANNYFALTGTPIENSLSELWSIFDFIMPNHLGTHTQFMERFEKPIVKEDNMFCLSSLKDKIKPFILRRMKKDVLSELPEKIENTMYADLVPEQRKLYSAYLAMAKNELSALASDENYRKNKLRILAILTRLRQISCHPALFDRDYKKDSGKLQLLEELLENIISSGHRALVFSQFTSMLDIIKKRLVKNNISFLYLDGSTPSAERTKLAENFNNGEASVFLISLKAGGTGLNLTGADTVIHYDPWWNPAVMDQASDRAHRIGQKRAVQVIKLASKGTIEEKIIMLQEKKRNLADDVITANQAMLNNLSKEELLSLFD